MEESSQVYNDLKSLIVSQKLAVLSTHRKGHPYSSLVCFFTSEDLKWIFFATPRTTRKFANIQADGRVSLLIDNRSNRESDIHQAMAATALGKAAETDPKDRSFLVRAYLSRHPYLEDFVSSPSCALVQVTVSAYFLVKRFQQVLELHFDDHSTE
jgi:hypothetical protein